MEGLERITMADLIIDGVDADSLQNFEEEGYSDEDALALAQGLLEQAVPCLATMFATLSAADKSVVKFAVLEMAKFIKIDFFNFERATSPFQSETIGSYSYNKMARNVSNSESTGVPGFDRAVTKLSPMCSVDSTSSGLGAGSSEQVFKPGYGDYRASREGTRNNEHYGWGWK